MLALKNRSGAAGNREYVHGSFTNNSSFSKTNSSAAQRATPQGSSEAALKGLAEGEAGSKGGGQAGREDQFAAHASAASDVPAVPAGMGGYRGKGAQRAGDAVCLSLLPVVAPRAGAGARIPQDSPGAVDQAAPGGGIGRDAAVA